MLNVAGKELLSRLGACAVFHRLDGSAVEERNRGGGGGGGGGPILRTRQETDLERGCTSEHERVLVLGSEVVEIGNSWRTS